MTEFIHHPVLLNECIKNLEIKPNGIYVDGTIGGGGHGAVLAKKLEKSGLLIGIDRDGDAIAAAKKKLEMSNAPFVLIRDKHENIRQVLKELNIQVVNGFLLDLGVSSHQLDTPQRGFSYRYDSPLDMRMDNRADISAYDIINGYSEKEIVAIIKKYGEERYAKRITKAICRNRSEAPVKTTLQLAQIITSAVPGKPPSMGHPAARTFQAIRIAVNGELTGLAQTIEDMAKHLAPAGRICIITFHSLEDRIVKQTFRRLADPCQCPKNLPYCICKEKPVLSVITKKPICPDINEIADNPRAHSAKLRVAEALER